MKKTTKNFRSLAIVATVFSFSHFVAFGQNVQTAPMGVGTSLPQGTVHIHSNTPISSFEEPPISINGAGNSVQGGISVTPPNPTYYSSSLRISNGCTGTTSSDGFSITVRDNEVTLFQHEAASLTLGTPGGTVKLDSQGRFGVGNVHTNYGFNVVPKSHFVGNVDMDSRLQVNGNVIAKATLTVNGNASVGYALTVGTILSVNDGLKVGSGFECDSSGNLKVKHLRVTLTDWPDYVFGEGYRLPTLGEVERYIRQHSHLPGVPSAAEVEQEGADLGEMNRLLMQKVEELTLYVIDLQKQINELKSNQ